MMHYYKSLYTFLCLLFMVKSELSALCDPYYILNKCFCGEKYYDGLSMFTVNCTNTGFVNTDVLKRLPKETQVLIFNGNNFTTLPRNVFGEQENMPYLHTVNLANNNIIDIPGKAFHHVSSVKRLILNNNKIRLSASQTPDHQADHVHTRLFSNFFDLRELQLINAFDDDTDNEITSTLHDVFLNSNLVKLTKLYLNKNKFKSVEDEMMFCDLQELKELHLDENQLTDISFNLTCLPKLQFLSLKSNYIENVGSEIYKILDSFPAKGQALEVDLQYNPWICKYGANYEASQWINSTKVKLRGVNSGSTPVCLSSHQKLALLNSRISVTGQVLIVLTVLILSVAIGILYLKRTQIRNKFNPLLDTVSHKMQYTTLRRREDTEAEV